MTGMFLQLVFQIFLLRKKINPALISGIGLCIDVHVLKTWYRCCRVTECRVQKCDEAFG